MSSIAERLINVDALATAIQVLAPQQANSIEHLYVLLDDAQKKGYAAGAYDAAERAAGENEIDRDNAWDDGYLQGVGDARARPSKADNIVQDILADMTAYALNGEFEAEYPVEFAKACTGDAKFNASPEGADWTDRFPQDEVEGPVEWTESQPYPTYEG